jgi:hypothetical protein
MLIFATGILWGFGITLVSLRSTGQTGRLSHVIGFYCLRDYRDQGQKAY